MPTYRKGEDQFGLVTRASEQRANLTSQPRSIDESFGAGAYDWKVSDLSQPISGDDLARGVKYSKDKRFKSPSSRARESMLAEDIVEHGKNKGKASEVRANLENLNNRNR